MNTLRNIYTLMAAAIIMLASGLNICHAQNYSSSNKKAIKAYEKGIAALQQGHGDEASRLMNDALEADNNFMEAHLVLAEWALDNKNTDEAKRHYRAIVEKDETFWTLSWLELAKIELSLGENDAAAGDAKKFMALDKKNKDKHAEAQRVAENAQFRKEALAHPTAFKPENMGPAINTRDNEYLPALTVDGETLVFTRAVPRRATTTANTKEEEDIMESHRIDGKWQTAVRMPDPVNSTDNEGAECISQDGRIMFFTACNRSDGGGRCDIYMCTRKGDKWSKPRNLGPQVNSGAWEGQPSFSIDGKTLYFVSNRKGGYGGMDIWKTVFENGHWTTPENLGPTINTAGDEMTPFIHYDDQTLYFASDGHIGMGGKDIYYSRRQPDGSWGEPVNMGYPINTLGDESNLIVDASGTCAYYSSDREGGYGKQDLWSFELPQPSRPLTTICYKGKVSDAHSGQAVASDIRVVNLADGATVANVSSDAASGEYMVSLPMGRDYAFMVTAKGFLFHSENCPREEGERWMTKRVDIALQAIEKGSTIALRNVFFETGKSTVLPESEYELGKVVELMRQNPDMKIELGGHTDNVGSNEANMRLSEARAKAVKDWLIERGIPSTRLSHKGYGETKPTATNDTEEGRAANRRTVIVVM